jgi:hypothetical protein
MPRTHASLAQLVKSERPLCCAQTKEEKPCMNKIVCDIKGDSVVISNHCHVHHDKYKGMNYNSRLITVKAFVKKVKEVLEHQQVDPDLVPQPDGKSVVVKKVIKPQTPSASKVMSANTKTDSASDSEGETSDSESVQEVPTSRAPKPAKLTTDTVELIEQMIAAKLADATAPTKASSSRKLVMAKA